MSLEVLSALQCLIERLHGTSAGLDVRSFLVAEASWRELPGARAGLLEQLFVREGAEGMDLGLYLAPEVVRGLTHDNPQRCLHAGNLELFCIALEGVSHFVLVAWRATIGRPVTPLELEMQAEVDKFVAAWLLLAEQGQPLISSAEPLMRQLFAAYALSSATPTEERERYLVASRVAQRFCLGLAKSFSYDVDGGRIQRAVHRFVRQELCEKRRAA